MYFQSLIAHFFLVLNSIPLSGWTIIYLSIHLPVDNLGCFQVLSIMNKGTINICMFIQFSVVRAGFRKGRGARDQIANIHWIIEKVRIPEKYLLLLY